jgi:hypothetical protein
MEIKVIALSGVLMSGIVASEGQNRLDWAKENTIRSRIPFTPGHVTSPAMFRRTQGAGSLYWLGHRKFVSNWPCRATYCSAKVSDMNQE